MPHVLLSLAAARAAALLRWTLILLPMAVCVGSAVALFLWALDVATRARFDHVWLIGLMPLAGAAMVVAYGRFGKGAEAGNNLIMDEIHAPGGGVPLRMAPFILVATVVTHLVGGSAGREGTAVQMGGALAGGIGRLARLDPAGMRLVLMAGVAAGFGAVFGTPLAGTVFAMEVLTRGRLDHEALIPALGAALVADWTVAAWGISHTVYAISFAGPVGAGLLAKVAVAGLAFGLCARGFAAASHEAAALWARAVPLAPLRPVLASGAILGLAWCLGTRAYLGLGVLAEFPGDPTLPGFFDPGLVDWTSWFWKALFTILTLSAGFKGGEVTPLFFIGAALGHALGLALGAPPDLMAALGFVAVFAGATNTPLACLVMGIELFGAAQAVPLAIGCFLAYASSGPSSIWLSQRLVSETGPVPLRQWHAARRKRADR